MSAARRRRRRRPDRCAPISRNRPIWPIARSPSADAAPKAALTMADEIKVPALGESVTEATVAKWMVKAGDAVTIDQPLCELETDKVTVEVNATSAGTIVDLAVAEGATVQVGGVLCHIEASGAGAGPR